MLHLYCAGRCALCVYIPSKDSARLSRAKKESPRFPFFYAEPKPILSKVVQGESRAKKIFS